MSDNEVTVPQEEMPLEEELNTQPPAPTEYTEVSTEAELQFKLLVPEPLKGELLGLAETGQSPVLEALLKKHGDTEDFTIAALEWWIARGLRRMLSMIVQPLGCMVAFAEVKGRYDPVELPEGASIQELQKEENNGESTN